MGSRMTPRRIPAVGITLGILLICPVAALAAQITNPLGTNNLQAVIGNIIKWANALAASLTTLMILVAGYLYLTGGGSEDQIKKAHRALTWAVIGFAVILFSAVAEAIIRSILKA